MKCSRFVVIALSAALAGKVAAAPALDYGFFKSKVEPIFLQKRPGHTRCYFCHVESNNGLHLEKLAPGQATSVQVWPWSVLRVIVPVRPAQ